MISFFNVDVDEIQKLIERLIDTKLITIENEIKKIFIPNFLNSYKIDPGYYSNFTSIIEEYKSLLINRFIKIVFTATHKINNIIELKAKNINKDFLSVDGSVNESLMSAQLSLITDSFLDNLYFIQNNFNIGDMKIEKYFSSLGLIEFLNIKEYYIRKQFINSAFKRKFKFLMEYNALLEEGKLNTNKLISKLSRHELEYLLKQTIEKIRSNPNVKTVISVDEIVEELRDLFSLEITRTSLSRLCKKNGIDLPELKKEENVVQNVSNLLGS